MHCDHRRAPNIKAFSTRAAASALRGVRLQLTVRKGTTHRNSTGFAPTPNGFRSCFEGNTHKVHFPDLSTPRIFNLLSIHMEIMLFLLYAMPVSDRTPYQSSC